MMTAATSAAPKSASAAAPDESLFREVSPTGETAVFRIFIKGPIDRVWDEITRLDGVQPCFFNMQMHANRLEAGGKMQMRTANGKYVGAIGDILEFDPPKRYAHTFRFTNFDDPPCRVIYDLEEKYGGTEFTMTLENLTPGCKSSKQMVQGGTMILNTLKAVVETGRPKAATRFLFSVVVPAMQAITPGMKKYRPENWPLDD